MSELESNPELVAISNLQLELTDRSAGEPDRLRGVQVNPDGDIDMAEDAVVRFAVPPCPSCGGILKPRVVFFGDNVDRTTLHQAFTLVDQAQLLLVAGSSLMVYSGFRFVRRIAERQRQIAIINVGETRGDHHAQVRLAARCDEVLPRLAEGLGV